MSETSITSPEEDIALIRRMMTQGQAAARADGTHCIIWGGLLTLGFFFQWAAIVQQWEISARLYVWLPLFVIGWALSLYFGRRNSAMRPDNRLTQTYGTAFRGFGIAMLVYFFAGFLNTTGGPGDTAALISAALAGSAFLVMSVATGLRWLRLVAGGWWLLLGYFSAKGQVDISDLLVLSAASILLILMPGLQLTLRTRVDN